MAYIFDGVSDTLKSVENGVSGLNVDQYSLVSVVSVASISNRDVLWGTGSAYGSGAHNFQFLTEPPVSAGWRPRCLARFSGNNGRWDADDDLAFDTLYCWGITHDGTSASNDPIFYIDGSAVAVTNTNPPTGTITTTSDTVRFGENMNNGQDFDGTVAEAAFYDRILTASEMMALAKAGTPANIMRGRVAYWPLVRRRVDVDQGADLSTVNNAAPSPHHRVIYPSAQILQFPVPVAGGTNYTLTAGPGSYTETGTAAGLFAGRGLDVESGSFVHTGTAVTLRKTWEIDAGSGTFTHTGTNANLEYGYEVDPAVGSYVITGGAAELIYGKGKGIALDSGSFDVTGQEVTLLTARYLENQKEEKLKVTGFPIDFSFDYELTVDSGNYVVTGQSVTLEQAYDIEAESGSFTYTGKAATLLYVQGLAVDSGSYSISGQMASLLKGYALDVDTVSYSVTGTAVDLSSNHPLAAGSGSFVVTGTDANLEYGRLMSLGAGSFTFTGKEVNLSSNQWVPGSAETEDWSGDTSVSDGFSSEGALGAGTWDAESGKTNSWS